jgi:hypothetical protein
LYDGAKFDKELSRYPNKFELNNVFVTADVMKQERNRRFAKPEERERLIFISDIRLGGEDQKTFEEGVTRDMTMQEEWVRILQPNMSLLKFRMSYNLKHGDSITYTKGDIYYGIWPKETSGETRLLVRKNDIGKTQKYDYKSYEQLMFFHNKYARPYCFGEVRDDTKLQEYVFGKNFYCPCYDCMSELRALQEYCGVMKKDLDIAIRMFTAFMNKEKKPAFLQAPAEKPTMKSLNAVLEKYNK